MNSSRFLQFLDFLLAQSHPFLGFLKYQLDESAHAASSASSPASQPPHVAGQASDAFTLKPSLRLQFFGFLLTKVAHVFLLFL